MTDIRLTESEYDFCKNTHTKSVDSQESFKRNSDFTCDGDAGDNGKIRSGRSLETLPFAINYCESLKIADICAK
ncbi:hypothetical protein L1987_18795 [Smallanthus sonchifolius]|uniref:Uncharacterized protein n=1 Tax=Smallanthus sonchifolius TaxID=185202 RepID=A0ACB9J2Y3_9ASTR|nr:hypothetical protein L1987_18795 [Smallanthus sonchifolius]